MQLYGPQIWQSPSLAAGSRVAAPLVVLAQETKPTATREARSVHAAAETPQLWQTCTHADGNTTRTVKFRILVVPVLTVVFILLLMS